jgi:HAD superfamily phosphoserine phosphatase-like hydrolase
MLHDAAAPSLLRSIFTSLIVAIQATCTWLKSVFDAKDQTIVELPTPSAGTLVANPGAPSVFVDLDGTLLRTEMGHTVIAFVRGLPHAYQRYWKTFLIPFVGLAAKIITVFSEAVAIELVAMTAIRSVTVADAAFSAEKITSRSLLKVIRPDILAEIKRHQAAGRKVAILTGSLEPLVKPLCDILGCVCIATVPEVDSTGTYYTGRLVAQANVSTRKVHHVVSTGHALNDLYGYGNTKNDIPFLSQTGNPFVVNGDKKLRRHGSQNGWCDKYAVFQN